MIIWSSKRAPSLYSQFAETTGRKNPFFSISASIAGGGAAAAVIMLTLFLISIISFFSALIIIDNIMGAPHICVTLCFVIDS